MKSSSLHQIFTPSAQSYTLYTAKGIPLSRTTEASEAYGRMLANLSLEWIDLIPIFNVRIILHNPSSLEFDFRCAVALLRSLVTRGSQQRPTPTTLPSHPFFSSLPISTLNFLDRSNFSTKSREEKISFMKGLSNVLDRFSEGLRTRKILPTLLEEVG